MKKALCIAGCFLLFGSACSTSNGLQTTGHISQTSPVASEPIAAIPQLVPSIPILPKPNARQQLEVYSVVVSQLGVHDLLFALARDARINIDVHPAVSGVVTLNAINQTLPQILERIAAQTDIRWSMVNGVLTVVPDTPTLRIYQLDYFNLQRSMRSSLNILNSVKSVSDASNASNSTGSTSFSAIDSESKNLFWQRLESNLKEILDIKIEPTPTGAVSKLSQYAAQQAVLPAQAQTAAIEHSAKLEKTLAQIDKIQAETLAIQQQTVQAASSVAAVSNLVVIHPETGTISIRATQKSQQKVAEYLAKIQASAQRQVLIEATIVEVVLSDQYQAGIDWAQIASGAGWSFGQSVLANNLATAPVSLLAYKSNNFNATVKLLEQFGKTRVLSSPKITALNNQPAVMKVVEELVYFTMTVTPATSDTNGVITPAAYESVLHTVPVGLVMQVTPQIAESGAISMNVRPTITNVSGYVEDPAVAIIASTTKMALKSLVPELQVREFDSTLKIASGQIAVLGGLIQDKQVNLRQGVPGLSRLPWIGDAFSYRDDKVSKIELVVFLRPIMIKDQGVDQRILPSADFFEPKSAQELSAFHSGLIPWTGQSQ
ncbi:pilus (MSHA type) biogenesis protein MshL [Deefgea salmonis]|uniref:Type II and III secretion system protein n=1 Tax=Deefgea salmonis TaxID=2875502 RepID=A0ABS8BLE5_9NEIS|nr:pilus (MSHA type) biogenesis protein MshL [Deefgea salmonis]MCB5196548.1 type II and III secretion system protein [Deefgea salmonis]